MSDIEARAQLHLTPLIQGRRIDLDEAAREAIAAWCALKAVTFKYVNPAMPPVQKTWIDWLYLEHTCPPEWHIWLAFYDGRIPVFYEVHDRFSPSVPGRDPIHGVQLDLLMGYVTIKVLGVSHTRREIHPLVAAKIVPDPGGITRWPPVARFSKRDIAEFFSLWLPEPSYIAQHPGFDA